MTPLRCLCRQNGHHDTYACIYAISPYNTRIGQNDSPNAISEA